jgi:hypothetical protein
MIRISSERDNIRKKLAPATPQQLASGVKESATVCGARCGPDSPMAIFVALVAVKIGVRDVERRDVGCRHSLKPSDCTYLDANDAID